MTRTDAMTARASAASTQRSRLRRMLSVRRRAGERYRIVVYGRERDTHDFEATLARCHVRDERGQLRYRTGRGQSVPDYTPPPGIGLLQKVRGTGHLMGAVWVPHTLFGQMLTLVVAREAFVSPYW